MGWERLTDTFVAERERELERDGVGRDELGRAHPEPRLQKPRPLASSSQCRSLEADDRLHRLTLTQVSVP